MRNPHRTGRATRRALLWRAALAGLAPLLAARRLRAMSRLPAGRSIYRVRGRVLVDGRRATLETPVRADSTVETGPGAEIVFAVGAEAFLVRAGSRVALSGRERLVGALRVLTGRLLSVYGRGTHRIHTPAATIGIRGTGVYVEAEPQRTYVCTCYGTADLGATADPALRETVRTFHHDAPRYIDARGIVEAPVINHTDAELTLLESLVGRAPPFASDGPGGKGGGGY